MNVTTSNVKVQKHHSDILGQTHGTANITPGF